MIGTWINIGTVLLGSFVGILFRQRLKPETSRTMLQGVGLTVIYIGLQMAGSGAEGTGDSFVFLALFSLLLGGLCGQAMEIEGRLENMGRRLQARFKSDHSTFTQGFVTASLLYLVGPMAIVGAIADGIRHDPSILTTKAMLDGIASLALGSTLGIGVAFSVLPMLVYQGGMTLAAGLASAFLSDTVIQAITGVGGLLIAGIGFNLLEFGRIRVGNLLPALVFAALAAGLFL